MQAMGTDWARAWLIAVAGVVLLSACGDSSGDATLSVVARTSLVAGPEFNLVETDLLGDVEEIASESRRHVERNAAVGDAFANGVVVALFEGLPAGESLVRVRLRRPDGRVLIERRVRVVLASGAAVVVDLTRDCVGVSCPGAGSAALTECLGGACVTPECTLDHPELCPQVVFCNGNDECSPVSDCAERTCTDGLCEPRPIAGACSADEWCDPAAGAGCTDLVPHSMDAGMPIDAGEEDLGMEIDEGVMEDASPPSMCGRICTVEGDQCHFGVWDCASGTPVCVALPPRPVGTPCGTDHVCNLDGVCVLCEHEGEPCQIGCKNGVVSCTRGYQACEIDTGLPDTAPGTPCYPGGVCYPEGYCETSFDVCSTDARCYRCTENEFCQPATCARGGISCAMGGVCVFESWETTGTQCSWLPASFCTDDHECQACTSGPCESSNPCMNAAIDCSVNPDVCADTTPKPLNTPCGDGLVCDGVGGCIACTPGASCGTDCAPATISCETGTAECVPMGSPIPAGGSCGTGMVCSGEGACEDCVEGGSCGSDVCSVGGIATCATGRLCTFGTASNGPIETGCATGRTCDGMGRCLDPVEAIDMSSNNESTCILRSDGYVSCAGASLAGLSPFVPDLVQITAGAGTLCARDEAGGVWCWGSNSQYQVGDGTPDYRSDPYHVPLPTAAIQVVASPVYTVCAILDSGELWCWGSQFDGTPYPIPTHIPELTHVTRVALSSTHACAVVDAGASVHEVWCWGFSNNGELGDGLNTPSFTPVQAVGISDAVDVVVSDEATCVLHATGLVGCFGNGAMRDVDGSALGNTLTESSVDTLFTDVVAISAGQYHLCVLSATGDAACLALLPGAFDWHEFGILGSSDSPLTGGPVAVTGLHNIVQLANGGLHSCARVVSGATYCWGFNTSGELSVNPGVYPFVFTPVAFGGLP